MHVCTISTNLDKLQALEKHDEYILHKYKWEARNPDIPNRVTCTFPSDEYEEAAALYHEMWKLRITPLFRNWF